MQFDLYTLFCYVFALLLAFLFAYGYERERQNNLKKFGCLIISFFVVLCFCGFRFFVGNDYQRYVEGFYYIRQYESNVWLWEPFYYWFNYLFRDCWGGYIYVFFISSFISCFFLFRVLFREQILKWGIFFIFTLGLLIFMNNGIRQGIAIPIFIYSLRYIRENKFVSYFLYILFAAGFHFSVLILLPLYLLRNIRFSSYLWMSLLFITFVLQYTGIFHIILMKAISYIPFYGEAFLLKADNFVTDQTFGLGILFKFSLALLVAIFYKQIASPFYVTLYLFGAVLDNIFIGLALFERVSNYLIYTNFIVFALFVKQRSLRQVSIILVVVVSVYFMLQSLLGLEKHGAVPYRTIYNEDLENPPYEYYEDE